MPPKKKEVPVERPILGRFKSNLKVISSLSFAWYTLHGTCMLAMSRR